MKEFETLEPSIIEKFNQEVAEWGIESLCDSCQLDFFLNIISSCGDVFDECGNHFYFMFNDHLIGELSCTIGQPQRDDESAFWFFDDMSAEAVEFWLDCLAPSKKHRHNILNTKFIYLNKMKIHPQLRGSGLGTEMLLRFEALMRSLKVGHIYLVSSQLWEEETVAHEFYQKMGYKPFKKMGIDNKDYAMFKRL